MGWRGRQLSAALPRDPLEVELERVVALHDDRVAHKRRMPVDVAYHECAPQAQGTVSLHLRSGSEKLKPPPPLI